MRRGRFQFQHHQQEKDCQKRQEDHDVRNYPCFSDISYDSTATNIAGQHNEKARVAATTGDVVSNPNHHDNILLPMHKE